MYRRITEDLKAWKAKETRKPLIIVGARQVGKTYIVREFAKAEYEHILEYNFQDDTSARGFFSIAHSAEEIIAHIELNHIGTKLEKGVLVFFDEIQLCPELINELKFLSQKCDCDFIASGSMLGVKIHQMSSWPVGYVEMLTMYPMTFEEFLVAAGIDQKYIDEVKKCVKSLQEIAGPIHEKFLSLFAEYLVCGGLPESVSNYVSSGISGAIAVNKRLRNDYKFDIAHYADTKTKIKAEECFDSIPLQLAKDNKKFQYNVVRQGYNARHYAESLNWLENAGLIYKTHRLSRIDKPLEAYKELGVFKVYSFDTGILVSQFDDADTYGFLTDSVGMYKGALCENYMAIVFERQGINNYYYEPNTSSEIDFIINYNGNTTPIEVKSGIRTKSKSFDNFIANHNSASAFRFSRKNIGVSEDGITKYIPLYAAEWV